jgi:hypothetical protein
MAFAKVSEVGFYRDFFSGRAPSKFGNHPRTRVFFLTAELAGRGRLAAAVLSEACLRWMAAI